MEDKIEIINSLNSPPMDLQEWMICLHYLYRHIHRMNKQKYIEEQDVDKKTAKKSGKVVQVQRRWFIDNFALVRAHYGPEMEEAGVDMTMKPSKIFSMHFVKKKGNDLYDPLLHNCILHLYLDQCNSAYTVSPYNLTSSITISDN